MYLIAIGMLIKIGTMGQLKALNLLKEIESQGVNGSFISNDGIFRYNNNMPTFEESAECKKNGLFTVPRMGDVLLSVRISGKYTNAKMYQYDGDNKIVYWEGCTDEPISPFKDGIPLLQVGKSIYIEVENGENIHIICKFAVLDSQSRKDTAYYRNGSHGIKLEHKTNRLYQAYNVYDIGYSPNVLAPIIQSN